MLGCALSEQFLQKFEPRQEVELFDEDNQYGRYVINAVAALLTRAGLPSRILIADGAKKVQHHYAFTPAFLEVSNTTAEPLVTISRFDAPPAAIHRLNAEYFRWRVSPDPLCGGFDFECASEVRRCGGLGIAEHLRASPWQTPLGRLGFEASGPQSLRFFSILARELQGRSDISRE
jgi:hypothetical protein